jgi:hypothetical protein
MKEKPARKPKLTDAERHKRFVDMAREVEASNDPKDFERAIEQVIGGLAEKSRAHKSRRANQSANVQKVVGRSKFEGKSG